MRTRALAAALVGVAIALFVGPLSGCVAPGIALVDIGNAKSELAAARTADAPRWAPYEYTSAELYLAQARDRLGHSGTYYQEAYEYAHRAYAFAHQAKEKAENHPKE